MVNLHVTEAGSGEVMVLLHGNNEDSTYFEHQIPEFAKRFRVLAADTRGHGKSPRGNARFTLPRFAEDLRLLLDSRGITRCILLGFSDGANIAMIFALKYPEYVDRMILCGGNTNPLGLKPRVFAEIYRDWFRAVLKPQTEENIREAEMLRLMTAEPRIAMQDLGKLTMPVLVIAGDRDVISGRHTRRIAEAFPDGRLKILPGGHTVAHDSPEAFNRAVLEFLEETEGDEADAIRRLWGRRRPGSAGAASRREAAILIPLVKKDGEYHVLFEVRAKDLDIQPGEICFPGGAIEPGETPEEACVRETMEELLVKREQVEILAPADGIETPRGARTYTYVGVIHDYEGTWSSDEVDHIFFRSLKSLLEEDPEPSEARVVTVRAEDFPYEKVPGGKNYPFGSKKVKMYFYEGDGGVWIWGMTARILAGFLEIYRRDIAKNKDGGGPLR